MRAIMKAYFGCEEEVVKEFVYSILVESLTQDLADVQDQLKTLKRRHTANIKDLTRQLQQAHKKLETIDSKGDNMSMGSRTSSKDSLDTGAVSIAVNSREEITPHVSFRGLNLHVVKQICMINIYLSVTLNIEVSLFLNFFIFTFRLFSFFNSKNLIQFISNAVFLFFFLFKVSYV